MEALPTDLPVGLGDMLGPLVLAAADRAPAVAPAAALGPALAALAAKDRHAGADSVGAAIFHVWIARLVADHLVAPVLAPWRPLLLGEL